MIYVNFNKNWEFSKGGKDSRAEAFFGNDRKQIIHLPHDAMIHEERTPDTPNGAQTGFYPGGEYIYQKEFEVPEEWKEKEVFLEFEGVYQSASVYLNGALAAKNWYGYSNFYVNLNPWVNFGKTNLVKVIADNTMSPNSRWYTGSGIYRDVNVWIGNRIHMEMNGVRVTTLSAEKEAAIIEVESAVHSISNEREQVTETVNLFKDGVCVGQDTQTIVMYPGTKEKARHSICICQPQLWDCENPALYDCVVTLEKDGEVLDKTTEHFGIRTLTLDSVRGLRINGKKVKLRGACIHHDNGILGAATLAAAEERRCRQLKEAGFNSIRSSHHPLSKTMLDACDRYGVLVMDELSDMWTIHKNPYDFASHFEECWEETVTRMVEKDYNHPCVILYSAGNEISEAGSEAGSSINRHICNKFHELDNTRFTTNGLNGLMAAGYRLKEIMSDIMNKFENTENRNIGGQEGSNALNSFMSLMAGEKGEYFSKHPLLTEALEGCSSSCDIIGLNYLTGRHELEHELHPNKTVIGTETYPADIVRLWNIVKQHPHVLGDFTWAGYDYLGEAGCGIFHYDGNANFSNIYPERTAYIGDLDLIGYRRPISYLREIVYGLRREPYIAVERLNRYGVPHSQTPWMHKDNIASWTWPGYEGKTAVVDVYSEAEEVELFLNGKSQGRKPAGEKYDFTASYELIYEAGILEAVSYQNQKETGRWQLKSAGAVAGIHAEADKTVLNADGEDLCFITVNLVDGEGNINLFEKRKIHLSVQGAGVLTAFGSAEPANEMSYDDNIWETYDGYVMAVIRAGEEKGEAQVRVWMEALEESKHVIKIQIK